MTDFNVTAGRITHVDTTTGRFEAQNIILATGMWSCEIGAKLGLRVPACAVEHQYIITESTGAEIGNYPTLRDPERLVFYKPGVGGRLVIGGYEDGTLPFGNPEISGQFVRQLLPENLDRFLPLVEFSGKVTSVVNEVGIRQSSMVRSPIPQMEISSWDGSRVLTTGCSPQGFCMELPPGEARVR